MKVEILHPTGYCYGVEKAINKTLKIRQEHPDSRVFVMGMLVHNEYVCDFLKKNGISTINVAPDLYNEELLKLHSSDIVIFTAHGHDEKLDQIAKERNIITYDAVCPMVKKNLNLIKKAILENKKVLYIGQENHPEAVAALSINNEISLISNKLLNHYQITTNKQIYCINQTTLNYNDLLETHRKLKEMYPNIIIQNEVCSATRIRQQSIIDLDASFDALIVVGSLKSSNTNKLYDIAKKHFPQLNLIRIQGPDDLDVTLLKSNKKVAITGGTSTPIDILQLVYNKINEL